MIIDFSIINASRIVSLGHLLQTKNVQKLG